MSNEKASIDLRNSDLIRKKQEEVMTWGNTCLDLLPGEQVIVSIEIRTSRSKKLMGSLTPLDLQAHELWERILQEPSLGSKERGLIQFFHENGNRPITPRDLLVEYSKHCVEIAGMVNQKLKRVGIPIRIRALKAKPGTYKGHWATPIQVCSF